jgi:hypothetical protein
MGMHYRVKEYGEWLVIRALQQRRDQARTLARTIATLYWAEEESHG